MRFNAVIFLLYLSNSLVHAQMSLIDNPNGLLIAECSLDFEVIQVSDSLEYQFLVLTAKREIIKDTVGDLSVNQVVYNQYYYTLSEFSLMQDDSRLYPIQYINGLITDSVSSKKFRTMKGLYLIDDFKANSDNLELTLSTQSGFMLQNQMYSMDHIEKVEYNPIEIVNSEIPLATKKWYNKWIKIETSRYNNPRYNHEHYGRY